MENSILKNAPLVEVIFEIKFKEPNKNYDLFVGELYSKLKSKYIYAETLTPKEIPALAIPYMIQHRFRVNESKYPLYQIGPAIVSFNMDGATYTAGWNGFKKELIYFLTVYKKVLGEDFSADKIENISLRYVDVIEDPDMYPEVKKYFDEKLKLEINLNFTKNPNSYKKLEHTSLSQTYSVTNNSILGYKIKTIIDGQRKLLIDSFVRTNSKENTEDIKKWLDKAHNELSEFFKEITLNIEQLFK